MAGKRKAYAPFSTSNEAGVSAAPVEGFIEVTQDVRPTIDTGFVDKQGLWQGHTTSDSEFSYYSKDEEIANGGYILSPADTGTLSMVGFSDIQIAIKATNAGNYAINAVMGSDGSQPYYNLDTPDAAAALLGNIGQNNPQDLTELFNEDSTPLTANVWEIFMIQTNLKNQARLAFKITNNSGGPSTIETMYLRLV